MKKSLVVTFLLVLLVLVATTLAYAAVPVDLYINGKEINTDVPPQLVNDRIMVPVRTVAETLGVNVRWDKAANAVRIDSHTQSISKDEIIALIKAQGKRDSYYLEELTYELVDLDGDNQMEIIAGSIGGVHLGSFFVFAEDANGAYQLVTEQDWKVEEWGFAEILAPEEDIKLFKLVTRTGGTGVSVHSVRLCYLNQGKFIEAWQGTMLLHSQFQDSYTKKVGGYQLDTRDENKRIYAWETTQHYQVEYEPYKLTPKGEMQTNTTVYLFDGERFVHSER
ncbi:MAG: copper amine oxidase N-terminal domain-containing protein [Firmicutes bacterium]|nr:copper amine oxidase N-terminal domain-containing protein [Bacillota bacterium]